MKLIDELDLEEFEERQEKFWWEDTAGITILAEGGTEVEFEVLEEEPNENSEQ